MFGITDFWIFVVAGITLNLIPGPDSLYIIGRSATQGFRAGSSASLGIGAGTLIHILAAALGLSAILSTSVMAFTIIKIIGCLYLFYIGFSMLLSKRAKTTSMLPVQQNMSLGKIFYQGFLTNALNPKVALFFLAFVPQFISHDAPNKALAFIILGLVFNINGMVLCHLLAWFSSSLGTKLKNNKLITNILKKLAGSLFIGFGVKLALSNQS